MKRIELMARIARRAFRAHRRQPEDFAMIWNRLLARFAFSTLLLVQLCSSPARAQVSASIKGVVTDASGAAVTSASVTAKNLETGAVRTGATDDAGRYLVLALPVGEYEVRVAKAGFR